VTGRIEVGARKGEGEIGDVTTGGVRGPVRGPVPGGKRAAAWAWQDGGRQNT
jgi:hypothetical protein